MDAPILKTVRQFAEDQPALTEAGIRWDLANRHTNGLEESGAIVYRGRRILIDHDAYISWMRIRSHRVEKLA